MKLCQKCLDAIDGTGVGRLAPVSFTIPSPESECEFWAHTELNNIINFINEGLDKLQSQMEQGLRKVGGKIDEA